VVVGTIKYILPVPAIKIHDRKMAEKNKG